MPYKITKIAIDDGRKKRIVPEASRANEVKRRFLAERNTQDPIQCCYAIDTHRTSDSESNYRLRPLDCACSSDGISGATVSVRAWVIHWLWIWDSFGEAICGKMGMVLCSDKWYVLLGNTVRRSYGVAGISRMFGSQMARRHDWSGSWCGLWRGPWRGVVRDREMGQVTSSDEGKNWSGRKSEGEKGTS